MSDFPAELSDRAQHKAKILALCQARPMVEIEPDELRTITPHYQQRISELRRDGWYIENVPRTLTLANGQTKKRDGAYRYLPYEPLGRSADTIVAQGWSSKHGRPFEESFRLKP